MNTIDFEIPTMSLADAFRDLDQAEAESIKYRQDAESAREERARTAAKKYYDRQEK